MLALFMNVLSITLIEGTKTEFAPQKLLLCLCLGLQVPQLVSAQENSEFIPKDDEVLRVSFRETVQCLNASAIEDHWLTSGVELNEGMADELDEYLLDSFPPDTFFRLESLRFIMYNNSQQATGSYLRGQDYDMNGECDLKFDIFGEASFVPTVTNAAFSPANAPTALRQNLTDGRLLIYSAVTDALAKTLTVLSANYTDISTVAPPPPQTTRMPPVSPPTKAPTVSPQTQVLDTSEFSCHGSVQQDPFVFEQGDFICSPSGKFKFGLTLDGDLALFEGINKVWSAGSCCSGEPVFALFQKDANLVVYTKTTPRKVVWGARISLPDTNASLVVGDDGVVTITDAIRGHVWSSAITKPSDRVSTDTLEGKVMSGYQGWFKAKGDGSAFNHWRHWCGPDDIPAADTISFDVWPDLREYDDDELYPTNFTYNDGSVAGLFSSYNAKTTERHTRWMKDYDIHGVFVQRFLGKAVSQIGGPIADKVLADVRSGAEKYGRAFVNMYDISSGNANTLVEDIINDWKHLVDDEHITKSPQYLYHRGRPLLAIWGPGFANRMGTPEQITQIINWFKYDAEDKYKVTLMGGIPTGWRTLTRASQTNPEWATIYRSFDVISPWAVGRLTGIQTSNLHRSRFFEPDLAECNALGIDYLPVVFPGFSFYNLKKKPFNATPRNGGTFMWHQMHNAVAAGSNMVYVAMFDEVDEGTAIFKIAETQEDTPREGILLAANADPGYEDCPGDWYLNITGMVGSLVAEGKDVPLNMPSYR